MNKQASFLSLLTIPSLLLFSPSMSIASTNAEVEVRQSQPNQLSQVPKSPIYSKQILRSIVRTLIYQGEWKQALDIMESQKIDEGWPAEVLILYSQITAAGELDLALQLAQSIQDEDLRNLILNQIALSFVKVGKAEVAWQIIQPLPKEDTAQVMIAVAEAFAVQGDTERILQIAQSIDDRQEQAVALSLAGNLEEALQLAENLEFWKKTKTLGSIAGALTKAGKFDQALELANSLPKNASQGFVLSEIVIALIELEQWEQALQVAALIENDYTQEDAATGVPTGITIWVSSYEALSRIANALTKAEKPEQALQVVQSMDDDSGIYRETAWENIAVEFTRAGKLTKALEVARSTKIEYDDSQVAIALAKAGKTNQAMEIAQYLEEQDKKADILSIVAAELTRLGKLDQAVQIAQSIEDEEEQKRLLANIARVLAEEGKVQQGLQLAKKVPEAQRVYILGGTANGLVTSDFDRAVNILQSLENEENKSLFAEAMATNLAIDGQVDRALKLAAMMSNTP